MKVQCGVKVLVFLVQQSGKGSGSGGLPVGKGFGEGIFLHLESSRSFIGSSGIRLHGKGPVEDVSEHITGGITIGWPGWSMGTTLGVSQFF